MDVFRIEPLAQARGVDDVREQDRHGLEVLLGRIEASEPGTQGAESRVHDGVAEDGALRLQGGDSAFELLALRHAAPPVSDDTRRRKPEE